MARIKPQLTKINNLDEADLVLKEIGIAERELEAIDAQAHKKIADIKENTAKKGEGLRSRITELASLLGSYAEYNKGELFREKKSVELTFGIFGYRKSTVISVKKATLELLKKLNLNQYIRIKEEPDKEKMSELSDEALCSVEAVRKIKDDFFCEANKEEINKELLKSQV
ncbi:MAG: host-nuclease inhibitor Gam family protein [Spirochaetes bacterium]|nr:host-nuclease inhibitor Gam family protein [Spirochaetota bacterium]